MKEFGDEGKEREEVKESMKEKDGSKEVKRIEEKVR